MVTQTQAYFVTNLKNEGKQVSSSGAFGKGSLFIYPCGVSTSNNGQIY